MIANQLPDERPSISSNNLQDIIDRYLELVSSYLVSSLAEYKGREKELRLPIILDKLKTLVWTENEKRTIFCLIHLGISYPNELKRLCKKEAQTYSIALESLMKKELVEEVEELPLTKLKRNYLRKKLKTISEQKLNEIRFFILTPAAKELFKHKKFEEELRRDIGEFISNEILREKAKFEIVIKQTQYNQAKQEEDKQREKDEPAQRNKLSLEIDELILRHKDSSQRALEEIHRLLHKFPNQKAYLIKKIKSLKKISEGKRENFDWAKLIEQAKRRLKSQHVKTP